MTLTNNGHTIQASEEADTRDTITLDKQTGHYSSSTSTRRAKTPCTASITRWKCTLCIKCEGELAVVAVMFDKGAENRELDKLWDVMPQQAELNVSIKQELNLNKLLPEDKTYWRFSGSLTTPPCSEGVTGSCLSIL